MISFLAADGFITDLAIVGSFILGGVAIVAFFSLSKSISKSKNKKTNMSDYTSQFDYIEKHENGTEFEPDESQVSALTPTHKPQPQQPNPDIERTLKELLANSRKMTHDLHFLYIVVIIGLIISGIALLGTFISVLCFLAKFPL